MYFFHRLTLHAILPNDPQMKLLIIFVLLFLTSCKSENIDGIIIGETLLVHQSYSENKNLKEIIQKCLKNNYEGFYQLNNYDCGGGSGCYDLGYVLTQIIYRIGENNFINSINKLNEQTKNQLISLINAGLEYGDNDYDNIQDNKKLEIEFPEIYKLANY